VLPSPNSHHHESTLPVDKSVKYTVRGARPDDVLIEKSATGRVAITGLFKRLKKTATASINQPRCSLELLASDILFTG